MFDYTAEGVALALVVAEVLSVVCMAVGCSCILGTTPAYSA